MARPSYKPKPPVKKKNPAAQALGRLGGLARKRNHSKRQLTAWARAANAAWQEVHAAAVRAGQAKTKPAPADRRADTTAAPRPRTGRSPRRR